MKAKLDKIAETVSDILVTNRKPLLIGGEHTLSLGGVQAAVHKHPDLKVVQLDAHADLRDVGEGGSRFSHDTVMRRVRKLLAPDSLIQVGIRSFAAEELQTRKTRFFKISETKEVDKIVNGQPVWPFGHACGGHS
jgi:agmatinase